MNVGMLWFDNDPKSELTVKIERAAAYYQTKYGQTPNLCFVHPSMLAQSTTRYREIEILSNHTVRPNHFWIGVGTAPVKVNA
jgi:hypothetical protein